MTSKAKPANTKSAGEIDWSAGQNEGERKSRSESVTSDDGETYSIDIKSLMSVFQPQREPVRQTSASRQRELGKKYAVKAYNSPEVKRKSLPAVEVDNTKLSQNNEQQQNERGGISASVRDSDTLTLSPQQSFNEQIGDEETPDGIDEYFDKTSYAERFSSSRALFIKMSGIEKKQQQQQQPEGLVNVKKTQSSIPSTTNANKPEVGKSNKGSKNELMTSEISTNSSKESTNKALQHDKNKTNKQQDIKDNSVQNDKSLQLDKNKLNQQQDFKDKSIQNDKSVQHDKNKLNQLQDSKDKFTQIDKFTQHDKSKLNKLPDPKDKPVQNDSNKLTFQNTQSISSANNNSNSVYGIKQLNQPASTKNYQSVTKPKNEINLEKSLNKQTEKESKVFSNSKPTSKTNSRVEINKNKRVSNDGEEFIASEVMEKLKVGRLAKKFEKSPSEDENFHHNLNVNVDSIAKLSEQTIANTSVKSQVEAEVSTTAIKSEENSKSNINGSIDDKEITLAKPEVLPAHDAHLLLDEVSRKQLHASHDKIDTGHETHLQIDENNRKQHHFSQEKIGVGDHESLQIDSYRQLLMQSGRGADRPASFAGDTSDFLDITSANKKSQNRHIFYEEPSAMGDSKSSQSDNDILKQNDAIVNSPSANLNSIHLEKGSKDENIVSVKRLERKASKEEIDAAMKKADIYWQHKNGFADEVKVDVAKNQLLRHTDNNLLPSEQEKEVTDALLVGNVILESKLSSALEKDTISFGMDVKSNQLSDTSLNNTPAVVSPDDIVSPTLVESSTSSTTEGSYEPDFDNTSFAKAKKLTSHTSRLVSESTSSSDGERDDFLDDTGDNVLSETPEDNVDGQFHILSDGNFYFEVPGLPELDDSSISGLKKINKLKFSTKPIKVYSTYSVDEYDRRNEDVNPLAASAEYELEKRIEKMDQFEIEIEKGVDGLGISIIGMGVGADAGLEKLGIFVKSLSPGGTAQLDGRMRVNDQIIEVDGKSLVGVTQLYAASVLRNTVGKVKFLLGRDKDPDNSEVARLIKQSVEQDKLRAELRQRQQEAITPSERLAALMKKPWADDSSDQNAPSALPERSSSSDLASPDDSTSSASQTTTIEVAESDRDSNTLDALEPNALLLQLKETQIKNAIAEAELARLKAKALLLGDVEKQRLDYEKRVLELQEKLEESEKKLKSSGKEIAACKEALAKSRPQMDVVSTLETENVTLTKKYNKAKKLIKDLQLRENEVLKEYESVRQQWQDRDQQYIELITSLNEQIMQLHKNVPKSEAPLSDGTMPKVSEILPPAVSWSSASLKPIQIDNISDVVEDLNGSSPDLSLNGDSNDNLTSQIIRHVLLTDSSITFSNTNSIANKANVMRATSLDNMSVPVHKNLTGTPSLPVSEAAISHQQVMAGKIEPDEDYNDSSRSENDDDDNKSDASSVSQTFYDPSHPTNTTSDIPMVIDEIIDGKISTNKSNKKASDNITLTSCRVIDNSYGSPISSGSSGSLPASNVRINETSEKRPSFSDLSDNETHSSENQISLPYVQLGLTADPNSPYRLVPVNQWTVQHVTQWLHDCGHESITSIFAKANITGEQLLLLDVVRMKSIGVENNKERDLLKKKIKDLKSALEKQRKQQEKEQKVRERIEKQSAPKKKRFTFNK